MKVPECTLPAFSVIGRAGSTEDGSGFVQRLWQEANSHYNEVAHLAKTDESGKPVGFWGAMSDMEMRFLPWEENFTKGRYLAGVQCREDALPPDGWVKWNIPAFTYLYAECDGENIFAKMLRHIEEQGLTLAGAVQDFTCPKTGKNYMFFPIAKN